VSSGGAEPAVEVCFDVLRDAAKLRLREATRQARRSPLATEQVSGEALLISLRGALFSALQRVSVAMAAKGSLSTCTGTP
jgi:hypothetical protein